MPTNYPGALDTIGSTLPDNKANSTLTVDDHASHHNNLADAVIAVETVLGISPAGAYASVGAAILNKVDLSPGTAQVILPTADVVGLTIKQHNAADASNLFETRLSTNALAAYIDKTGVFSAQALKIAGTSLASTHLSDSSTLARLAGPALTGVPTAPTAAVDTNTTQLATTAFVLAQAASASPLMDGTVAVGTSTRFARADHVHPTDTSLLPKANPTVSSGPLTVTASGITFSDATTQTTAAKPGVQVVTALPGSPTDGLTIKLRLGTSPYRYITLTYDATYAKWVSEDYMSCWNFGQSISHNTTISTVSSGVTPIAGSENYALLRAAGLHMQMRFIHRTWNDSGSSGVFWIDVMGAVSGAAMRHDTQVYTSGFITWSSTPTMAGDIAVTSWRDTPLSTTFDTDDLLYFYGSTQSNASPNFTTTHTDSVTIFSRWVA